ncbi:MtnX-like HAD-IB family phosphatase [candidate division KSB1 bacterium]
MIVFCDFDGTITVKDVGAEFFNNLMVEEKRDILDDWLSGKIDSKECLTKQCTYVRATKEEINSIIDKQEIDGTFLDFYKELKRNRIELIILSDGLDYYISRILKRYGLDDIRFYSNRLILYDDCRVRPEFPYYDPECDKFANCKGLRIRRLMQNDGVSVYIGDGYSDICALPHADVIFAKGDLFKYCSEQNIPSYYFNDFDEILGILKANYPSSF